MAVTLHPPTWSSVSQRSHKVSADCKQHVSHMWELESSFKSSTGVFFLLHMNWNLNKAHGWMNGWVDVFWMTSGFFFWPAGRMGTVSCRWCKTQKYTENTKIDWDLCNVGVETTFLKLDWHTHTDFIESVNRPGLIKFDSTVMKRHFGVLESFVTKAMSVLLTKMTSPHVDTKTRRKVH